MIIPCFFVDWLSFEPPGGNKRLFALTTEPTSLVVWLKHYQDRLSLENTSSFERQALMNQVNPYYVLRRHLLDKAIHTAEQKDFSEFHRLLNLLQNPFQEQENTAFYSRPLQN